MYFLQKDDIMLDFTLSGSSDITGCQCLLFVYFESVAGFKFRFKLNVNWKVMMIDHNFLIDSLLRLRVEIQKYFRWFLVQMKSFISAFEINCPLEINMKFL